MKPASNRNPHRKSIEHTELEDVGRNDSSFNTRDENGRRTGYAYEYQLKVAAHTGWTYEYVTGSWSDLMDMLRAGDIDMMSDVSYTEDARIPFREYLEDHVYAVIIIVSLLLLIILFLMARSMRAEKKSKRLIAATEIDDLTGLYNRDYFLAYAERLHKADPDKPMDAIVLNIEQFHSVNALSGRNFGDRVLRVLGRKVDGSVNDTIHRADKLMYANKSAWKEGQGDAPRA